MNREIKFRGKRIDNGEWISGSYWNVELDLNHKHLILPPHVVDKDTLADYEVNPKTIRQFTGLKDKNGVEIYEKNIVKLLGKLYEVIFTLGKFVFAYDGGIIINPNYELCEVIDSIHEYPELPKGAK